MTSSRLKQPIFIAHLFTLGATIPLVLFLTFTYMYSGLFHLRPLAMTCFLLDACLSNLLGGLAIKRIGHSPWLGMTGFIMGFIPLILFLVLPDRSSKS